MVDSSALDALTDRSSRERRHRGYRIVLAL
jgi:hypothetical protein